MLQGQVQAQAETGQLHDCNLSVRYMADLTIHRGCLYRARTDNLLFMKKIPVYSYIKQLTIILYCIGSATSFTQNFCF